MCVYRSLQLLNAVISRERWGREREREREKEREREREGERGKEREREAGEIEYT